MGFFWRQILIPIVSVGEVSDTPVSPPDVPSNAMLFEDGTPMLFEDGDFMIFED